MGQFEYSQLKSSINDYGIVQPIVIDSDLNLLDGFSRVDAAKDLGIEEIEATILGEIKPGNKKVFVRGGLVVIVERCDASGGIYVDVQKQEEEK
jgi:hypothetical protein